VTTLLITRVRKILMIKKYPRIQVRFQLQTYHYNDSDICYQISLLILLLLVQLFFKCCL